MSMKLREKKGETLIEALIAVLIAVLSMAVLSSAILFSANMNQENRKRDEDYAQQLYDAEGLAVELSDINAKVHVQFHGASADASGDIDIILYGGEENDFVSYEEKEAE